MKTPLKSTKLLLSLPGTGWFQDLYHFIICKTLRFNFLKPSIKDCVPDTILYEPERVYTGLALSLSFLFPLFGISRLTAETADLKNNPVSGTSDAICQKSITRSKIDAIFEIFIDSKTINHVGSDFFDGFAFPKINALIPTSIAIASTSGSSDATELFTNQFLQAAS